MFHAQISKALIFKKVIESIRELVTDVNMEVSQDGISLQALVASHVALVTFHLRADKFEEFHCTDSQVLGISIANLSKILKCADNDDRVTIDAENPASKVKFTFEGREDDKVSEFRLNLLSLDCEQLGIPDQEYTAVITMKSDEFSRICRELSQISDTLVLNVDSERIKFTVTGDIGDGDITIKHRETGKNPTIIAATERVECHYAMRYLNLFNKASTLAEEISLSVSGELPLIIYFDFQFGYLKYYLAPKVSDD